jgi:hypothetical protein
MMISVEDAKALLTSLFEKSLFQFLNHSFILFHKKVMCPKVHFLPPILHAVENNKFK